MVKSIYGASGLIGKRLSNNVSDSPWISILKAVRKMDNDGIQLFSFCKKKVGDGKSTLFWDDIWLGDSSLKVQFPRVYALETDKSALVQDRLVLVDWDLVQRRLPRGGGGFTNVGSTGDVSYGHYI